MDGVEATKRIRAGEAGETVLSIPIVTLAVHLLEKVLRKLFG
jgi:hypothetical protein